jgi:hypothetical protein
LHAFCPRASAPKSEYVWSAVYEFDVQIASSRSG